LKVASDNLQKSDDYKAVRFFVLCELRRILIT
jgi:hypothetical protein